MPFIGTSPVAGFKTTTKQSFSGDNSTTAFTLNRASSSNTDLEIFVDNIQQEPTTAYSVSGTTLTFSAAPPNLSSIEVEIGFTNKLTKSVLNAFNLTYILPKENKTSKSAK